MLIDEPTGGPAGTAPAEGSTGAPGAPANVPPGNVGEGATTASVDTGTDPYDTGADSFDRAYVEKLRREAAGYRTKAQPYEEVFSAYDDEEREFLLAVTRDLGNPDKQADAARRLRDLSQRLLEDADPDPDDEARNKPLTLAELEQRERDKAAEQAQRQAVEAVEKEAADLGYEKGSPDYAFLMYMAANHHDGSLTDAHEAIGAGRQAIIDKFVEEQKAKGDKWITTSDATGGAPSGQADEPKTWASARDRATARAKAAMQQAAG